MDYERIGELSGLIAHWKKSLQSARSQLKQARADEHIAERNIRAYERQMDELLAKGRANK